MKVGYLIRTTAVYGNGKFGLSDLENIRRQNLFNLPFQPEMLCVYLARWFSFDWVEHVAYHKNPDLFRPFEDRLKKALGVGNATGLGMAPFLINHPKLICRWMNARENALAEVRAIDTVSSLDKETFKKICSLGVPVILDGGIKEINDAKEAYELGATGVLINSMLFTDNNPIEKMFIGIIFDPENNELDKNNPFSLL